MPRLTIFDRKNRHPFSGKTSPAGPSGRTRKPNFSGTGIRRSGETILFSNRRAGSTPGRWIAIFGSSLTGCLAS